MLVSQKIINQEQNRITFILFTLFSKTCFTCLKSYTNVILRENSKKWYFFSFFTLHWAESMVFGGPSISRLINGTSVCATSDFLFCNLFYFIFCLRFFAGNVCYFYNIVYYFYRSGQQLEDKNNNSNNMICRREGRSIQFILTYLAERIFNILLPYAFGTGFPHCMEKKYNQYPEFYKMP